MTIKSFLENNKDFTVINEADFDREIKSVYCCDLLSVVMGQAPADCAWVTVMGNVNAVAVYVLADMSLIILAENAVADEIALNKAKMQGVNILKTELPVFETALSLYNYING